MSHALSRLDADVTRPAPGFETPPQRQVADAFMAHKGLSHLEPLGVEQESRFCWYFIFDVNGAQLDLRVEWLLDERRWDVGVDDFRT